MRWNRLCRLIGLAGVVFFLAIAFSPLAHILDLWTAPGPQLVPSDAIVVLAADVSPSGILSRESALRTAHGISLYFRGLAPLLVLSGGAHEGGPTQAEVRVKLARRKGIPSEAILTETAAHTTQEEALRIKGLLQERGVRAILLVTNSQHLLRARPLFERAGFEVHPAPSDTFSAPDAPEERLALMREILKDLLGWVYYRLAGLEAMEATPYAGTLYLGAGGLDVPRYVLLRHCVASAPSWPAQDSLR